MVNRAENDLITRVEGDAPLGRLMRENYWMPVRVVGESGRGRRSHARAPVRRELRRLPRPRRPHRLPRRALSAPPRVARARPGRGRRPAVHLPRLEDRRVRPRGRGAHPGRPARAVLRRGARRPLSRCTRRAGSPGCGSAATRRRRSPTCRSTTNTASSTVHDDLARARQLAAGPRRRDRLRPRPDPAPVRDRGDARASAAGPRTPPASVRPSPHRPRYQTEEVPSGLRQASLRPADDDRTYVRVAHYFFPFVVVVPNGYAGATHLFCFAPVDDTHHLVFFGNYGETPLSLRDVSGALDGELPDPPQLRLARR